MSKKRTVAKIPVTVPAVKGSGRGEKYGNPHVKFVRRQSNDQIMNEFLLSRGLVRLRLQPSIQKIDGNYYGWLDGSVTVEAKTVEEANMFVDRLRKSMLDIATELRLTVKVNSVISS